jgi:hypothetical protein
MESKILVFNRTEMELYVWDFFIQLVARIRAEFPQRETMFTAIFLTFFVKLLRNRFVLDPDSDGLFDEAPPN